MKSLMLWFSCLIIACVFYSCGIAENSESKERHVAKTNNSSNSEAATQSQSNDEIPNEESESVESDLYADSFLNTDVVEYNSFNSAENLAYCNLRGDPFCQYYYSQCRNAPASPGGTIDGCIKAKINAEIDLVKRNRYPALLKHYLSCFCERNWLLKSDSRDENGDVYALITYKSEGQWEDMYKRRCAEAAGDAYKSCLSLSHSGPWGITSWSDCVANRLNNTQDYRHGDFNHRSCPSL